MHNSVRKKLQDRISVLEEEVKKFKEELEKKEKERTEKVEGEVKSCALDRLCSERSL